MLVEFNTKEEFKELKRKYGKTSSACWEMYMYNFFKGETWCYYVEEDCFISLEKANKLGIK
jgi:uncharacterized protein YdeI (YjbR/CyaY-like superfamily)